MQVVMVEPFLIIVVVMLIPDSGGTEMKTSAAQNGKISLGSRDILSPWSIGGRGARLRPQGGGG